MHRQRSSDVDGRRRRRYGKQKQQKKIEELKAELERLQHQVKLMAHIIESQQQELDDAEAGHASPVLLDSSIAAS
eukprot:12421919-Karenia_brevis.AAC.1